MASSYTPRLNIPEMADGEGSGYVTFNELSRILDGLLHSTVQEVNLTTPPGSPTDGQCWIVGTGATGAWAGQDGKLAQWFNGVWYFYTRPENFEMYEIAISKRVFLDAAGNKHELDVPVDGDLYGKRNGIWEMSIPSLCVVRGSPASGTVSTGGLALTNWSLGAYGQNKLATAIDAITGVFTAPLAGIYRINIHINSNQGNSIKEESLYLQSVFTGGANDGTFDIAHESVDTDKTSDRTLTVNFLRDLAVGETLSLRLRATASLGTFTFEACTFDVTLIN